MRIAGLALKEFSALDQMYSTDFAKGATVTASSTRKPPWQESHLTDGKDDTSWALKLMPQPVALQSI